MGSWEENATGCRRTGGRGRVGVVVARCLSNLVSASWIPAVLLCYCSPPPPASFPARADLLLLPELQCVHVLDSVAPVQ